MPKRRWPAVNNSTGGNEVLSAALQKLRWNPARLGAEIDLYMGKNRSAPRSTVSDWVLKGTVPHAPLPAIITHILTEALGESVDFHRLWQGRAKPDDRYIPALQGLDVSWDWRGVLKLAEDSLANIARGGSMLATTDRRVFLEVSSSALTSLTGQYIDHSGENPGVSLGSLLGGGSSGTRITPAATRVIETVIDTLRNMDDTEGGAGDALAMAHHHFVTLADCVRNGSATEATVAKRVVAAWAQLCQIAGWMAVDAGKHGQAQRYYGTGLHAAQSVGDRDIGAVILACMGYQALSLGDTEDAVQLMSKALKTADRASDAVRAVVWSRYAHAQAAVGNEYGFRDGIQRSHEFLNKAGDHRPVYLEWFRNGNIKLVEARSTLALLPRTTSAKETSLFLREAFSTYRRAFDDSLVADGFQRDKALHSMFLGRATLQCGDVDEALAHAQTGVEGLDGLRSTWLISELRDFGRELKAKRWAGYPPATRFLENLAESLIATPV